MKSKVQTAEFKPKPVAQRHHLVSGTLALLKYLVIYMNVKQSSSPNRGQSPVEWAPLTISDSELATSTLAISALANSALAITIH